MPVARTRSRKADAVGVAATAAALVYAWFASGVRTFTRPAEVLTAVPVVAVLLVTLWPHKRARRRSRSIEAHRYPARGVALWLALFAVLTGWEMFQLFSQPRERHPTISSLLNTLISTHPSRFAGYLLFLAAGWLLIRDLVARRE